KSNSGKKLFEEDGSDTSYFQAIKAELTDLALDFQRVYEFSEELINLKLLKPIDFEVATKYGKAQFKRVFIGDVEALSKIQPEKLYFLNTAGYLPIIYSIYFSVRNFKLFDLL
ncbi:MAG: hypothetical protein C0169_00860, partial [Thermodesulfobacterium geofontis]